MQLIFSELYQTIEVCIRNESYSAKTANIKLSMCIKIKKAKKNIKKLKANLMKTSFLIISFLFTTIGFAQSQPKLEDYALANSDVNVVVFPFGMDNPVKIGTVSKSGHINFEFPTELPKISKETQENFMSDLAYTLFDVCDDGKDMISDKDNRPSFEAGMLSLTTTDNPYAGVITAISDEALMPWITDPGYEETCFRFIL